MNRRSFLSRVCAAVAAAAIAIRIQLPIKAINPPAPQPTELTEYYGPWSYVRPMVPDLREPLTQEEWKALCAAKSPPAEFKELNEADFFPTWEV